MTIYSAIQRIANSKGLSIYQIERDLNLSNGNIGKWNKSMPRADKLQSVADYLGVTTTFILNKAKEEQE